MPSSPTALNDANTARIISGSSPPPAGPGIHSQTLLDSPALRLVRFTLDQGEQLTEHTTARPALVQILSGECEFFLGPERHQLTAGDIVWMPAHTPHAVVALRPLAFLLTLAGHPPSPESRISLT